MGVEGFGELARVLLPTITEKRVRKLYKLRKKSTHNRYETDSDEMKMLKDNINVARIFS